MHPIERLRHVARAEGAGPSLLGREAAAALAGFAGDPAALVTACRRLVDRHPSVGPIWWTAARVLGAGDPAAEAHACADQLGADPTSGVLAADLPGDATVLVIGWPELAAGALMRRADVEVLVADGGGRDGNYLARRLLGADVDAVEVPDAGVGAAAANASLVVVEAVAAGGEALAASAGSLAAAAVASHAGVPVWAVVGEGRVLPRRLWDALLGRLEAAADPWDNDVDVVPLDLVTDVAGPAGRSDPSSLARRPDCPVAPELLRPPGL